MKFSELNLHPQLKANLEKINFEECTPIQEQSIPITRTGKDLAGLAQTGTGKTGAFIIPILDRLLWARDAGKPADSPTVPFPEWKKRQFILILVPTRELCEQVQETTEKFIAGTGFTSVSIYGGTSYERQIKALKEGAEFVIATPGRLIDLYKEHVADLGQVRAVVFDEADRMFDMGFKDDMKFILRRLPRDRQFCVFSATLNFDVLNVAYEFGADPVEVNISRDQAKAEHVKDYIFHCGHDEKPMYLLSILKKVNPKQTIIFSNFKRNVERISRFLNKNGVPAVGISSLLTQAQRNRVMEQFKADNDRNIMVATDLAARGLDILGVDLVINFELPEDPENYVHRIGRTGRAGAEGTAYSFVSDRDVDSLSRIESYLKHKVEAQWLEEAEMAKDFAPYPSMDEVEGRGNRPPRQGRDRGGDRPRPNRGGGEGRRPQRGGDRGPRREGQGPRQEGAHRQVGRQEGPKHEGHRRPQGEGQQHRDRQSGRHRDDNRGQRRDHQNRGHHQGQPGPHQGQRRHGTTYRPDGKNPSRNSFRHHRSNNPQNNPAAKMAAPSLGKKVTGFFKKLFGAED